MPSAVCLWPWGRSTPAERGSVTLAIVDYGSGNLRSASRAFERVVRELGLDIAVSVTADADTVARADRVVLPGVGAFGDCRRGLAAVPGMEDALEQAVVRRGAPFLGICVGMQLMATRGFEHGEFEGLGWIAGDVAAMAADDRRVPHMGWNDLRIHNKHPVLAGLATGDHMYFVHSYQLLCADERDLVATVDYGGAIAAVVARDNRVGTQFHPEKSQAAGLRLIANFLTWRP